MGASPGAERAFAASKAVADTVLYEGYLLYPYRASSAKNKVRFQWGVVVPEAWCVHDDRGEHSRCAFRCLFELTGPAQVTVRLRFLQAQARRVEALEAGELRPVERLVVGDDEWLAWDEAVEAHRDVVIEIGGRREPVTQHERIELPEAVEEEAIADVGGVPAGRVVRRRRRVTGAIDVAAEPVTGFDELWRVGASLTNDTPVTDAASPRDQMLPYAFLAAHFSVHVEAGTAVSMVDPPEAYRPAVDQCRQDHLWPVLLGSPPVVLASPIILYDQTALAPESPGDLFDATEIDELLTLRVMTLTQQEKAEARATDPRAAEIVDRCEELPDEALERLHGAIRSIGTAAERDSTAQGSLNGSIEPSQPDGWWDPATDASVDPERDRVSVGGVELGKGDKVRLRPRAGGDAHDMFLVDRTATVAGVFFDVDGSSRLAVTVDDDPAAELYQWHGRYLYFKPDEVAPLEVQR